MSSEDSEDEPLSVLAALKKNESELEILPIFKSPGSSSRKLDLKKKCDVSIRIQSTLPNEAMPMVERPADVWLYLTDFNVTGPYTCLLCSEWFLNRNRIVIHYVIDHKKEYCGICRYLLPDRDAWWDHQKFHAPWKCSQCEDYFATQNDLRTHFSEAHNLVHCQFCSLRVPNDEQYHKHLFQKHSVTKMPGISVEILWDFECKGTQKFQCMLCAKSFNVGKQFADHFMSYHHITLKCFAHFIAGIDLPFQLKGIDVTPEFIASQLSTYSTFGYVDFVKSLKVKEVTTTVVDEAPITVDCEPELKEYSENCEDSDDLKLSEEVRGYKGLEDFDITLVEVVVMQKYYYDYVCKMLNEINSNTMPLSSDIAYTYFSTELRPINCCFCPEVFTKKNSFETHVVKMHCVKTLPTFWCRVCAAGFDGFSELETHCTHELGEFDNLWICQFCDKEFEGREEARRHLTDHWDLLEYDNCFSPHLGFKCKFCPTLFWNETDRELHHVRVHFQKNKSDFYNCKLCGEVFGDKVFFIYHYQQKHNNETPYLLKCFICSIVMEEVDEMRAHFEALHPDAIKIFCCIEQCKFKPFSQRKSFHMHLKTFHNPTTRQSRAVNCEQCGMEFSNAHACALHASKAHGPGRFSCKQCDVELHNRDERKLHYLLRHPGRNQYQCNFCEKSFQHKSSLYMHKQSHTPNKKDYNCNYCGKIFLKKDSYREHLMIHEAPKHACSYCPMRFVQRSNMLRHERRHTGERPYACQFCPRTFADKGACTSHSRTHLKSTSFACVYCGQTFVQKSKLTYHIRKHTGENLETCSVCSKMFTSACSLREHMRVHKRQTMKKTIKCPLCKKMFSDQRDLMRHMRNSHTGIQFKCPLCRKTVSTSCSLREHVLTHSEIKSYRCLHCPKAYHAKKSIVNHLEKRHDQKPPVLAPNNYRQLDPKECELGLDDDVIEKIFGKVYRKRTNTDVLIGDFVSFNKGIQLAETNPRSEERKQSEEETVLTADHVQVKLEPYDGEDEVIPPPDFVNVKIEFMEEENQSDQEVC